MYVVQIHSNFVGHFASSPRKGYNEYNDCRGGRETDSGDKGKLNDNTGTEYSRLSLSRIPRDSLKYFEVSVVRHIRFAELRKI